MLHERETKKAPVAWCRFRWLVKKAELEEMDIAGIIEGVFIGYL